ncbi:conserved hypothetical protein [Ricinus communis]|uniref:Uncharacterized protein n=1 Tax=Ricinus communis TaxID=3988 RepID=B9TPI0_RICCO|nr:conserved hypothetical protein [Ricinus communis]
MRRQPHLGRSPVAAVRGPGSAGRLLLRRPVGHRPRHRPGGQQRLRRRRDVRPQGDHRPDPCLLPAGRASASPAAGPGQVAERRRATRGLSGFRGVASWAKAG